MDITLKNFRCFPDDKPARLRLDKEFTALVGVNNSGKSSLLRFFYELRPSLVALSNPGTMMQLFREIPLHLQHAPSIIDPEEIFFKGNQRDLRIEFQVSTQEKNPQQSGLQIPNKLTLRIDRQTRSIFLEHDLKNIGGINDRNFPGTQLTGVAGRPVAELRDYFEAFKDLSEILYIPPFRNAINVASTENYYDILVGTPLILRWREIKTGNNNQLNENALKLEDDIKRVFDLESVQINASADGRTLQISIDGKIYRLHELGSGLTQFFLVLANAIAKRPSYILIDEPELNLHPSLQIDFLTTLASHAREGIVFGTHSIGLARSTADRIYALKRIKQGETEMTDFEGMDSLSEFLGELSFSGYRELGFNSVLLTDGPNDIRAIQQFLRMYKKDHQIVLLPLGGSGMINGQREPELLEIKRICGKISAVVDSERSNAGDPPAKNVEAFDQVCKKVGVECHVLERRAIENYLTQEAITTIKGNGYRALGHYQKLSDVDPCWSKPENWRIAREMSLSDIDTTDLGGFLKAL